MISFRPVSEENFTDCIKIETGISPEYLAPVVTQIAMSYVYPSKIPLAIYKDENIIGFISYEKDTEPRVAYDILVIVIRKELQGKGLGRLALEGFIDYLFGFEDCDVITLNYNPDNERAGSLYKSLGFTETGEKFGLETILELKRG